MTSLVGTASLVRLALRRDRVILPICIAIFVALVTSSTSATIALYPTVASRVQAAASLNNTASLVAFYGRIYDGTSLGAVAMLKMGGIGTALVAVLALLTVIRHTRAEEESGRLELLGAAVVGRHAPLTAALLVAVGASLVLGGFTALGLIAVGLPAAGSIAFGLAWAGVGAAFAALAAVAAQLTRSARAASGIAGAALGLSYLLRAIGDSSSGQRLQWLSWMSPIGWGQQVRPFAGERWWVMALLFGVAVALAAGAYALASRRDLGAGLLPDRAGPATAARGLRTPLALAWRLQRGALLGWLAAFVVLGAVFGGIASNVGAILDSPQARDFITALGGKASLSDAYLAAELGFVGVFASVYGVQAAMRVRSEETAQRVEPLLATALGRIRWAWSHLAIALAGTATLLLAAGLSAGLAYAAQTGDIGQVGRVLGGALVQLPAAWVLTGVVMAAFGLAPKWIAIGWVALVAFVLLGEFGPLFKLNHMVMAISPFDHVPKLPGGALTVAPLLWLSGVAAVLIVIGLSGFRRRDVG